MSGVSRGESSFQRLTRAVVMSAPIPTVATTATTSVHTVERTERSFVASDANAARTAPPPGARSRCSPTRGVSSAVIGMPPLR